jgi:hypothetical protein
MLPQAPHRKGAIIAVATAGLLLIGSTAALAYIQATGGGDGTIEAATQQDVDLEGETGQDLYPGQTVPITVTYSNYNTFTVRAVNGIHFTLDTDALPDTCDPTDFTFTDTDPVELTADSQAAQLPAEAGGSITWHDTSPSQNDCMADLADFGGVPLTLSL